MQEIAQNRGGECLSTKFLGNNTKLKWKCKKGHVWEAVPRSIKRYIWCPVCAGHIKKTIQDMQELAQDQGGTCLSTEYVNSVTKLTWQCKEGHTWEAIPNSIQQGSWCPICAGHGKKTIQDMQKLAHDRGGKCLSTEYIDSATKLTWQCKEGHTWEARPNSIQQGSWCPKCRNTRK